VSGQRQKGVVLIDGNVGVGQDLKRKRIGANATRSTGRIDLPACYIANWYGHDSILPVGNCTNLIGFVIEAIGFSELI
jgi:hypothetical protein